MNKLMHTLLISLFLLAACGAEPPADNADKDTTTVIGETEKGDVITAELVADTDYEILAAIGKIIITEDGAFIYKEPSTDSEISNIASEGVEYLVLGQDNDWLEIGNSVWIHASAGVFSEDTTIGGVLGGITPDSIRDYVEDYGISCGDQELGSLYYVFHCELTNDQASLLVSIYGRMPNTVDYINASSVSFSSPDDQRSIGFFALFTSIEYDGAIPNDATSWMRNTLPLIIENADVRTNTYGGVEFELFGLPTARTLKIGALR